MKSFKKLILTALMVGFVFGFSPMSNASAADMRVPILMYHNLTVDGETNSMTITQQRFREDMEFLQQHGYTPLLSADLINIKSGAEPMPAKPVMITFDDGYESNYTLAYPILQETGMKATISVITSHLRDGANVGLMSSMTWIQAREMYYSGIVDIGTHTHKLHNETNAGFLIPGGPNGVERHWGESWGDYQKRVGDDIRYSVSCIEANIPGAKVLYFSYPFGKTDDWFGQVLLDNKLYVSTTTQERTAEVKNSLYGLPRFHMDMEHPLSTLLAHSATAKPVQAGILVNGQVQSIPAYEIDGSNYVKLRDVATLVNGTPSGFSVDWEQESNRVVIHKRAPYAAIGGELEPLPEGTRTAKTMQDPLKIDNEEHMFAAYYVEGNYYFQLRGLGQRLGFQVNWDTANNMISLLTVA